ncbi:phosphopantetheine-binding protein, partial [Scytonema sp. PCC 10023]|uniref:phosphopantetheine-binding protein n=1 Tax=Scytonema sp. PCC 10023 TaxID=1680591 RepID=UPI0039C70E72
SPGEKRLVAYVVTNLPSEPASKELRSFLKNKLPEYMVPSAFVILETLPLTPNGKLDRKALPVPDLARAEMQEAYVAPRDEMERTITAVWQEALHLEKVGIYDNFFDLGGHSLLIIQVHNKLQEVLTRDILIIELFQYPTINSLSEYLNKERVEQPSFEQSLKRTEFRREAMRQRRQFRQTNQVTKKSE